MNFKAVAGQFTGLWSALSGRQRLSIAIAAATVVGGLLYFTSLRKTQDLRPLFTNMAAEDAGAIVEKLKESGVEYKVAGNGSTVLVPSSRVAELRLQMASAGIPRTGRIGFELFDKTNLGTTDFAEQVNYRRALEGELERSIRAIAEVEQARVHLTFPKDSVFLESKAPAKASVLITLRQNAQITKANVAAIVQLVASAVDGLTPEAVSVTDSQGNLLSRPKDSQDPGTASDELIEYRQKIEKDLTAKVNSTLEPLLGPGRYRVGLSVECDFTSGEQSEEIYDPEKSVMVTTQKSEESSTALTTGGVPGTGSALPRPVPRSANAGTGISKRSENVTYQSSKLVRRTRLPQGSVKRISASVLLDQTLRWEVQNGRQTRVMVPPSAENLKAIQDVVAGALGIVPSRGDQLVVQSLPFESTLATPPPPMPVTAEKGQPGKTPADNLIPSLSLKDWRIWAATGIVSMLVLGWAALRWRKKRRKQVEMAAALPEGEEVAAIAPPEETAEVEEAAAQQQALPEPSGGIVQTVRVEQLVDELRASIAQDPALAASVLRTWLEEVEV